MQWTDAKWSKCTAFRCGESRYSVGLEKFEWQFFLLDNHKMITLMKKFLRV
jgi:hypothetical protein